MQTNCQSDHYNNPNNDTLLGDPAFNQTLLDLFDRRLSGSRHLLSQLSLEHNKLALHETHFKSLLSQLQGNRQSAIQALKLRHHEIVLRLDQMLEQKVEGVLLEEKQRS